MKLQKIPPADLKFLLISLPKLAAQEREICHLLIERRADIFASDALPVSWSHLYEHPFLEHVARVVVAFDEADTLKELAAAERPVLAAASYLNTLDADESEFSPEEKESLRPQLGLIFGLVTSLLKSLRCLMAYGVYLNDLVAQARLGGKKGDSAVFKAVRIDPTAIAAPSIHARVSRAVLEDDQEFLDSLKQAMNGPLSKQHQANADKIRFVLQVLDEAKIERLSDDEVHDLFVKQLALYAEPGRGDAGDAAKGIRAIARRMKKAKATT